MALLSLAGLPFVWTAARSLRTYAGMLALLTLLAVFLENALPAWADPTTLGEIAKGMVMAHAMINLVRVVADPSPR